MTLTEFLLARIAEDEAAVEVRMGIGVDYWTDAEQEACERVAPARVLAECEAKRRIVSLFGVAEGPEMPIDAWILMRESARALAMPYAGHSDYDESWRS